MNRESDIQKMFEEMGLGNEKLREKLKRLSEFDSKGGKNFFIRSDLKSTIRE